MNTLRFLANWIAHGLATVALVWIVRLIIEAYAYNLYGVQ